MHARPRSVKQLPCSSNLETVAFGPNPQRQCFSRSYGSVLWTAPQATWKLGDVMRLWVREGLQMYLSFGFSSAVGCEDHWETRQNARRHTNSRTYTETETEKKERRVSRQILLPGGFYSCYLPATRSPHHPSLLPPPTDRNAD